jgi:glycosyltransferase involved in cell wall biosynthesis
MKYDMGVKKHQINKILYFLDFSSGFGGAANTLLKQAQLMHAAGLDVVMTIPVDEEKKTIEEYEYRCRKYHLPFHFLFYTVTAIPEDIDVVSLISCYDDTKEYISALNPDIVHSTQINVTVEMVCRKLSIPHIMNIYQIEDYFFRLDYPEIFPRYHICDSELYKKEWEKYIGCNSICIRNPCDLTPGNEKKYNGVVIACVGSLCERKNQMEAIKAVRMLIKDGVDICLHLYGHMAGEYGEQCLYYVRQNNLEENVKFKGFVPFAETEIAKCAALVCASKTESFPNVISEAIAAGVPVISTPVAGVPELLQDLENAYLSSGYEEDDIYISLKTYYEQRDTKRQQEIIKRAHKTYLENFSPVAVSAKLLDYYEYVQNDFENRENKDLDIDWFIRLYGEPISAFKVYERIFTKPANMRKMIWQIPYIREKISRYNPDRKLIIWGAGTYGSEVKKFAELFFGELELKGFIDRKKTGYYLEYPIFSMDRENWEDCIIWIATVAGQQDIYQLLQDEGKEYQKDFFMMVPRVW